MAGMYCMGDLLELILREGAGELRLRVGDAPVMVLRGEAKAIKAPVVTMDNVTELFESIATGNQVEELHRCGDVHFIYEFRNSTRFAVAATTQRGVFDVKFRNLARQA